jgi:hypothetical protein
MCFEAKKSYDMQMYNIINFKTKPLIIPLKLENLLSAVFNICIHINGKGFLIFKNKN